MFACARGTDEAACACRLMSAQEHHRASFAWSCNTCVRQLGAPCAGTSSSGAGPCPHTSRPFAVCITVPDANAALQIAKRQGVVNPEDTFFSVKRFIGSKYDEVKEESTQVPYTVKKDEGGNVKIHSNHAGKDFAPEEISAQVLRKLVDDAGACHLRARSR